MSAAAVETADVVARVRRARRRRATVVLSVLVALLVVVAAASVSVGSYSLTLPDLLATLAGRGSRADNLAVFGLRLPRFALAVLVGVAFGLSGALFQNLLRNPLASPDIIGVSGGASAAAIAGILLLGLGSVGTSLLAFAGALAVATAIYLLAWRGGVLGYRFVLVGIATAFLMQAVIGYLLTRAEIREASGAFVWLVGSISSTRWQDVAPVAVALAVLLPAVIALSRSLTALDLGDDAASGLGVRVERTRALGILVAVALAALGTAAAGPVAFVAFVSGPIARRLLRTGAAALPVSALVGALVMGAADFVAQHLLPGDVVLPVGIVTGAVGAPYLLYLLATANRTGRGA